MRKNIIKLKTVMKESIDLSQERATMFFKTNKGDYAYNDQFMGIRVPTLRKIASKFKDLPYDDLLCLLQSKFNEERLLALIILVLRYKSTHTEQERVYSFYMQHLNYVNNWNLVDSSAHLILGAYLFDKKDKSTLIDLAKSDNLWERRISIVATWYFIKRQDCKHTIKIATILLNDRHDLIHKAVGWMLREVGKQNQSTLIDFLDQHSTHMPRTMLRYAIEKFPKTQRNNYLGK